ncbi:MAG: WG repeat-containing protein [Bacteroidales bacterium]|nr:WG repeat-containing protein [Bacteroidales bacterium]
MNYFRLTLLLLAFAELGFSQIKSIVYCDTVVNPQSISFKDTCYSFVTDSLTHNLGFVPQTTGKLYKYFKYVGDEDVIITRAWTGDPHFICDYPQEKLKKNEIYHFTVCFTFIKRPGRFKKMMGFELSNGERISFTFSGIGIPSTISDFQLIGDFSQGYAPASYLDNWVFIDNTFTKVLDIPYECVTQTNELDNSVYIYGFSDGMAPVKNSEGLYSFINLKGELITGFRFKDFREFKSGIAPVCVNSESYENCWGYINKKGQWIVEPKYYNAYSINDGLALVELNNRYGFINEIGGIAVPIKFTFAGNFCDGLCFVSQTDEFGEFYVINSKGDIVISGPFDDFCNFENGTAIVQKGQKCLRINTKGEIVEILHDSFCGND